MLSLFTQRKQAPMEPTRQVRTLIPDRPHGAQVSYMDFWLAGIGYSRPLNDLLAVAGVEPRLNWFRDAFAAIRANSNTESTFVGDGDVYVFTVKTTSPAASLTLLTCMTDNAPANHWLAYTGPKRDKHFVLTIHSPSRANVMRQLMRDITGHSL